MTTKPTKDEEKTVVIFLKDDSEPKNVFAFFPKEHYHSNNHPRYDEVFGSYAHVGQHSACSKAYAEACKPAGPQEYATLQKELEGIGYNLDIHDDFIDRALDGVHKEGITPDDLND